MGFVCFLVAVFGETEFLGQDDVDIACAVQDANHVDAIVCGLVEDEVLSEARDGEKTQAFECIMVMLVPGTDSRCAC